MVAVDRHFMSEQVYQNPPPGPRGDLVGKVALITGAASGIGLATIAANGSVLDTWFPAPELIESGDSGTVRLSVAEVPDELAALAGRDQDRGTDTVVVRTVIGSLEPTGLRPSFLEKFEKRGQPVPQDFLDSMKAEVLKQMVPTIDALYVTARLWDDGLIAPRDSRKVLAFCLRTCLEADRRTVVESTFGIARM